MWVAAKNLASNLPHSFINTNWMSSWIFPKKLGGLWANLLKLLNPSVFLGGHTFLISWVTTWKTFEALSPNSSKSVSFANHQHLSLMDQSLLQFSLQLSELFQKLHFQIWSDEHLEHHLAWVQEYLSSLSHLENVSYLVSTLSLNSKEKFQVAYSFKTCVRYLFRNF